MAERYGPLTLQIKALADMSNIGSAYETVISASGSQKISAAGSGSFVIPRDASTISAIDSNIGQVAYVYQTDEVASGAAMEVASFIIEDVDKTTDPNGLTVRVSGKSIETQLTFTPLDDDTIDDGSGGKDTSDIDSIMGYAPSGWTYTINGGAGTGSGNGTYYLSRGNNVLQLLIAASKQNSGEFFRLSQYAPPTKVIDWRTSADSSGVTLRMPASPTDYDGSTTDGIIYSMSESASFKGVVTRIRPYGAGLDDGRLDITGIDATDTGGDPTGFSTFFGFNLIVNDTAETALGYTIKEDQDFSDNRPDDVDDATQNDSAAVALWNEGITYLQARDSTKKYYDITCNVAANLRPGQTVTLSYTEYEGGITGGSAVWTVSGTYTIQQITNTVSNGGANAGIRITKLLVGETTVARGTGAQSVANAIKTTRETTRKSNALTTPGAVSTGLQINTDLPLTGGGDLSANRQIGLGTLSAYGSANQLLGMVNAANDIEYKTLAGGTGITITPATGSLTVNAEVQTSDLHDRLHNVTNALDHSVTGSAFDLVGLSATNTLAILTPVSNSTPSTEAILKSDSSGGLRLQNITTDGGATFNEDGGNSNFRIESQNKPDFFFVDADQDILLIGDTTLDTRFPTDTWLQLIDGNLGITADGSNAIVSTLVYGSPTWKTSFQSRAARGTRASPTAVQADDVLARIGGGGYNGTAFSAENTAYLEATATQTFSGTAYGSRLDFYITPDDSTTAVNSWRMTQDSEIQFLDSAVAHGMTNQAPTDVYGQLLIRDTSAGGFEVAGYRDADGTAGEALTLIGRLGEAANTAKTTAAIGVIHCISQVASGTGVTSVGSNGNLFTIRNHTSTAWIVDAEGDTHRDGSDNTFDSFNDAHLARAFDLAISPGTAVDSTFDNMLEYNRDDLIAAGILHESGFYNESRLLRLAIGGLWQAYTERRTLETKLKKVESKLKEMLTSGKSKR